MTTDVGASTQPGVVVDLFAGPGGWSTGLRALGVVDVGIEIDPVACDTRVAEGHLTVRGDVTQVDPRVFGAVWGLISSPPCQPFSMSGKRRGRPDVFLDALKGSYDEEYLAAARAETAAAVQAREEWDAAWRAVAQARGWVDEGRGLNDEDAAARDAEFGLEPVVEDERGWLMAETVRWIERTNPVWVACEQVPTVMPLWNLLAAWLRERGYSAWTGILNAANYGVPQTRERAILIARRDGGAAVPPAPTHCQGGSGDVLFGESLLPWVTMSDALGWDPGDLVGFPRLNDQLGAEGAYRERDLRPASMPSFALTGKVRSWTRRRAIPAGSMVRTAFGEPHRGKAVGSPRPEFDPYVRPSRTVVTKVSSWQIVLPEGATVTVDGAGPERISTQEAAVLQSFPADYAFAGSNSKQAEQVGNSVPPVLAACVVSAASGVPLPGTVGEVLELVGRRPSLGRVSALRQGLPEGVRALVDDPAAASGTSQGAAASAAQAAASTA